MADQDPSQADIARVQATFDRLWPTANDTAERFYALLVESAAAPGVVLRRPGRPASQIHVDLGGAGRQKHPRPSCGGFRIPFGAQADERRKRERDWQFADLASRLPRDVVLAIMKAVMTDSEGALDDAADQVAAADDRYFPR